MKPFQTPSEEFKAVIAAYPGYAEKEAAMKKMYASDRKDMRRVLSLYNKGKWAQAAEMAGHMDTAAREHIPQRVWDHIQSAS